MDSLLTEVQWDKTDLVFSTAICAPICARRKAIRRFYGYAVKTFAKGPLLLRTRQSRDPGQFSVNLPATSPPQLDQLYYVSPSPSSLSCWTQRDKPDNDIEYHDLAAFDNYRTERAGVAGKDHQSGV